MYKRGLDVVGKEGFLLATRKQQRHNNNNSNNNNINQHQESNLIRRNQFIIDFQVLHPP